MWTGSLSQAVSHNYKGHEDKCKVTKIKTFKVIKLTNFL